MNCRTIIRNFLFLFFLFTFACVYDASAYIDPGTGSLIVQAIIAGIAGGLFAIKTFWRQIKSFFSNLFSKKTDQ
jgi:hypothetical protein